MTTVTKTIHLIYVHRPEGKILHIMIMNDMGDTGGTICNVWGKRWEGRYTQLPKEYSPCKQCFKRAKSRGYLEE